MVYHRSRGCDCDEYHSWCERGRRNSNGITREKVNGRYLYEPCDAADAPQRVKIVEEDTGGCLIEHRYVIARYICEKCGEIFEWRSWHTGKEVEPKN